MGFKKGNWGIFITLVSTSLIVSSAAKAANATNFLEELRSEVTNRMAAGESDGTAAQRRALSGAGRALSRTTRTLATDLGVLASAAAKLNAAFTNDETFSALQAEAVADYSAEAHARMDGIYLWIGTNEISRGLSNRVVKAEGALERADAVTNGVPEQARALALAFNRILPVERKVRGLFDEPVIAPPSTNPPPVNPPPTVPPGTSGFAPDSIGTRYVNCWEDDVVNDQTVFYFSTAQSGAQIYNVHHPEELGLWVYARTGANTGVITVDPDYPDNAPQRPLNLTFTNSTSGTFTGTTYFGQPVQGTFAVID